MHNQLNTLQLGKKRQLDYLINVFLKLLVPKTFQTIHKYLTSYLLTRKKNQNTDKAYEKSQLVA